MQIGGEIGKNNSLPLKYFAELAKNLQTVIDTLVECELPEEEGFDRSNFQLELTDFQPDGVIPGFSFTKQVQSVVGGDAMEQRKEISKSFENLISMADSGNYEQLNDIFPETATRKKVAKSFFGFVDSLKTPKVAFGNFDSKKGFKSKFKVRKYTKEIRQQILDTKVEAAPIDTEYVYGRIKLTKQNGKERKAIAEIFENEATKLSYVFEKIETPERNFELTSPVYCSLQKSEDAYSLASELLHLSAKGETQEEAVHQFASAFNQQFSKLENTKYGDLTEQERVVKTVLTVLVR